MTEYEYDYDKRGIDIVLAIVRVDLVPILYYYY